MAMKIKIVGYDHSVRSIFAERGFQIVPKIEDADAVVWTGGQDINPGLYGQKPLKGIGFSPSRDNEEVQAFKEAKDKFKIGICRGAQLLNVLSGGSMFQHVDKHTSGPHLMFETGTGRAILTTSLHHQMMRPAPTAKIIATATGQSTYRLDDEYQYDGDGPDPEVVWYEDTKSFCFQGHPEYGHEETKEYFFEQLAALGVKP